MTRIARSLDSQPRTKRSAAKTSRTQKITSKKKKAIRVSTALASLEAQLEQVIERPGMTIFFGASSPRKSPKKSSVSTPSSSDRIYEFDQRLVQGAVSGPLPLKKTKTIPIHFAPHQASEHLAQISVPVLTERLSVTHSREPLRPGDWLAPFEIPPSLDEWVARIRDLYIEEVDPRLFFDQFTPADARVAFTERFGLWSKLRAPFIRWEHATVHVAAFKKMEEENEGGEEETVTDVFDEQFTPQDPTQAFRSMYGWRERLRAWTNRWTASRERDVIYAPIGADQEEDGWSAPMLVPRLQMGRILAGFAVLALFVSLPAGAVTLSRSFQASSAEVKNQSFAALAEVKAALQSAQTKTGDVESWRQASKRFQAADQALSQSGAVILTLANVLPEARGLYGEARAFLKAGDETAQAGRLLTEGIQQALAQQTLYPDERLLTLSRYLDAAALPLEQASTAIGKISSDHLPEKTRPQAEAVRTLLSEGRSALRDLRAMTGLLISLLGHTRSRSYLLVFQNQTELRPTGGFMGSLAQVTFDRGTIKQLLVPGGGPYDFRDQLSARVLSPKPLQLINARWEFQDANWFPDFAASARKIEWFWSKAGQPTVDGVIAVNERVMERLLTLTGPIDMPEYGKVITADNFLMETQKAVELEYDKQENKPKKFIGDLMPKILSKLETSSREDWPQYLSAMTDALETKDIQIYLNDENEDALVRRFGWRGEMKPVVGDALAIVSANIGGQKTDGVIQEAAAHDVSIREDGQIIDTLTLTRRHGGQKGELFRGSNNVEYVRVYVPQGSELLEASGFSPPDEALFKPITAGDVTDTDLAGFVTNERTEPSGVTRTDEFGRTAFGGWIQLRPGGTSTTTFRYRLPFTVFDLAREVSPSAPTSAGSARAAYLLLMTSQSGKPDRTLTTTVQYPPAWQSVWTNQSASATSSLMWTGAWDRDHVLAGLFHLPHD